MRALILMTRIPIPGKTKTRLMSLLSGQACADIHIGFLKDLFITFNNLKEEMDIFLTYTPEHSLHVIEDMVPDYVTCFPQQGESLGLRMANSIQSVLDKGYSEVVLIGSDIPHLQSEDILKAFGLLEKNDLCIGPTFDGGYYLIGMKQLITSIFEENLKWGNKSVFESTVDIANTLGLKVGLATKYRDIDTKEDLEQFKENMDAGYFNDKAQPIHTMNFIKECWGEGKYVKKHIK